ncbi:MAG TPA: GNAT family protein [Flavipsychrobacter sp.]|nr:GNAT family protein [Flavipsychrobacter sp.]
MIALPVELETERLILKGIIPATIHELFRTRSGEELLQFFGGDEAVLERFKGMHEYGMETHRISLFSFMLVNKETGETIGDCGYHTLNKLHRRAELGYGLRLETNKQKGYMTEALGCILDYGFTQLGLHRVEALVAKYNTPSIKLLQRYGFSFEGTMREDYVVNGKNDDSDCYSLLKWEWEKHHPPQ